jgi:hypothetical protein
MLEAGSGVGELRLDRRLDSTPPTPAPHGAAVSALVTAGGRMASPAAIRLTFGAVAPRERARASVGVAGVGEMDGREGGGGGRSGLLALGDRAPTHPRLRPDRTHGNSLECDGRTSRVPQRAMRLSTLAQRNTGCATRDQTQPVARAVPLHVPLRSTAETCEPAACEGAPPAATRNSCDSPPPPLHPNPVSLAHGQSCGPGAAAPRTLSHGAMRTGVPSRLRASHSAARSLTHER